MDEQTFEKQIQTWRRFFYVNLGASVTLLLTALADMHNHINPFFPGWFGVWLVIQLMSTPPGFLILVSKVWRSYPLSDRMNLAFGYLGLAWITLLAFILAVTTKFSSSGFEYIFMLILAVVLVGMYVFVRKTKAEVPEEMFP